MTSLSAAELDRLLGPAAAVRGLGPAALSHGRKLPGSVPDAVASPDGAWRFAPGGQAMRQVRGSSRFRVIITNRFSTTW
jgi:hypothetical protein